MWNRPPPPGFCGLDPCKPLTIYTRHLPHWRQDGATYFITFRQADSLPQETLRQLEQIRAEWLRSFQHAPTPEQWDEFARDHAVRVERWLDQGLGTCRLKGPECARLVADALHHFDGDRYQLGCYVLMPNHVHALVRPLRPEAEPLEQILRSWKQFTSREFNRRLGLTGAFWQDESFDRIVRDEEHLFRCLRYIGSNPAKAGMGRAECPAWVRPE